MEKLNKIKEELNNKLEEVRELTEAHNIEMARYFIENNKITFPFYLERTKGDKTRKYKVVNIEYINGKFKATYLKADETEAKTKLLLTESAFEINE